MFKYIQWKCLKPLAGQEARVLIRFLSSSPKIIDADTKILDTSTGVFNRVTQCKAVKQKGMTVEDWNKRWEDRIKPKRWELLDVHPLLRKYAPSSVTHPKILVSLAGKTTDLFWLVDKGFQVVGIECSSLAIEELLNQHLGIGNYTVEKRSSNCSIYSALNNQLILVASDIFDDKLVPSLFGGPASCVWDRAALSALHPVDHSRYIHKLKQLSLKNAQFLLSVYWHSGPTDSDPPFPISSDALNKLFLRNDLRPVDELDSMNNEWVKVGYRDLCERLYLVQL